MTREEAIKLLKQYQGYEPMFPDGETLKHAFDLTDETVDTLLSALRPVSREQQVILCKDCRYWQGNNGGYPHPECRWGNDETPDADDYCSFAERMEVNKNGRTVETCKRLRGEVHS